MKILGAREQRDHPLITRLDQALGGAILASGAVYAAGWHVAVPANILLAIWGWADQKSTAMELVRAAADSLSGKKKRRPHGPERRHVITAAHTTIVVAAFYEALEEYVPREFRGDVRLTDAQTAALQRDNGLRRGAGLVISTLYEWDLPAPSAARGFEGNVAFVRAWMTSFSKLLSDFRHQQGMRYLFPEDGQGADPVPWEVVIDRAVERYRSHFLQLAGQVDEFRFWAELGEHAATRDALSQVHGKLSRLVDADDLVEDLRAIVANANRLYLTDPIIEAGEHVSQLGVTVPPVERGYVNPRFRVALMDGYAGPYDPGWWQEQTPRDDFDDFLVAYVLSADATRLPLLLLGDPGAGKSMLTKVLAARLPARGFTVVRVPLRRITADVSVRPADQVQEALDQATGRRVDWPQLSRQGAGTIPVILLDGLDELLQASDHDRRDYLREVTEFQRTEAAVGRDVIVIVTSRVVVADRVDIPPGATVVKLDEFSDEDVADWLSRWNGENAHGLSSRPFRALEPEVALRHGDLARQPLLLLMLALYTADPALPALDADLPMGELYELLLTEFARREARKDLGRDARPAEVEARALDHLDRLMIAAFGMFNRGRQDITEQEAGADLRELDQDLMTRPLEAEAGQRTLGEFFFVHAAEARLHGSQHQPGPRPDREAQPGREPGPIRRSYEFLHATFGEYLVARHVMRELARVGQASGGKGEAADDLLFALLSHQVLAARPGTLDFARDIFRDVKDDGTRARVLEALEVLTSSYRTRRDSGAYRGYQPTQPDLVRHLACYSANLVSLRVALALAPDADGVALARLFRGGDEGAAKADGVALARWRSTVLLWQAALDPRGLSAMVTSLTAELSSEWRVHARSSVLGVLGMSAPDVVTSVLLAKLLGDDTAEDRIRYGAAIRDDFHYVDDRDHAGHPNRWIHQFAGDVIPMLAGKRTYPLPSDPPPGISDHHARIAAGRFSAISTAREAAPSRASTSCVSCFACRTCSRPIRSSLRMPCYVIGRSWPTIRRYGIQASTLRSVRPCARSRQACSASSTISRDSRPISQPAETAPSSIRGP